VQVAARCFLPEISNRLALGASIFSTPETICL
jgi:hypothetical protein